MGALKLAGASQVLRDGEDVSRAEAEGALQSEAETHL